MNEDVFGRRNNGLGDGGDADPGPPQADDVACALDAHQRRRERNRGCISLLVGSGAQAAKAVASWAGERAICIPPAPGRDVALTAYIETLSQICDLPARALEAIRPADDWTSLALKERARRIAQSPLDQPARRLVAELLLHADPPPVRTFEDLTEFLRLAAPTPAPVLFLPAERLSGAPMEHGWLITLLETAPHVPLVANLPAEAAANLSRLADGGDRVAAVLRESAIRSPQLAPAALAPFTAVSPLLGERPSARLAAPPGPPSPFDSKAEALLASLLDSAPLTRGLFTPQGEPGFLMGNNQPARIDLLCERLSLAIEIDGPHHFEPTQYRRDRYKDLELQRAGYIILRFLADDVVNDPQAVLGQIHEVVLWRSHRQTLADSV